MNQQQQEKLDIINSIIKPRKPIGKRGRYPEMLIKTLKILSPCIGYRNGITSRDLAYKLYGYTKTDDKIKARQQVRQIRIHWDIYIYSATNGRPGAERRYFHLQEKDEFNRVIKEYTDQRIGLAKGELILEEGKETEIKSKELKRVMVKA